MPVFKNGKGLAPKWCKLKYFEIVNLQPGTCRTFERIGQQEKMIVVRGKCHVSFAGQTIIADVGRDFNLNTLDGQFKVTEVFSATTLIRLCGDWGDEAGGFGIFTVEKSGFPRDCGDPVEYFKETNFDSHYHDCDEYWILFEGGGIAVSEGKSYHVGPGDCVATSMGHHHDFPRVFSTVKGVYFETALEGKRRQGHLWNHKHGLAQPGKNRI